MLYDEDDICKIKKNIENALLKFMTKLLYT